MATRAITRPTGTVISKDNIREQDLVMVAKVFGLEVKDLIKTATKLQRDRDDRDAFNAAVSSSLTRR